MKTNLFPLLLAATLAGCKAHMMETHGDKVQLFKTGLEKPGRGGVIQYLRTGPKSFQTARRADAEKQMKSFCGGGPYTITKEGPRSQVGSSMPIGNRVSIEMDQYQYVAFECSPDSPGGKAAPALIGGGNP